MAAKPEESRKARADPVGSAREAEDTPADTTAADRDRHNQEVVARNDVVIRARQGITDTAQLRALADDLEREGHYAHAACLKAIERLVFESQALAGLAAAQIDANNYEVSQLRLEQQAKDMAEQLAGAVALHPDQGWRELLARAATLARQFGIRRDWATDVLAAPSGARRFRDGASVWVDGAIGGVPLGRGVVESYADGAYTIDGTDGISERIVYGSPADEVATRDGVAVVAEAKARDDRDAALTEVGRRERRRRAREAEERIPLGEHPADPPAPPTHQDVVDAVRARILADAADIRDIRGGYDPGAGTAALAALVTAYNGTDGREVDRPRLGRPPTSADRRHGQRLGAIDAVTLARMGDSPSAGAGSLGQVAQEQ